MLTRDYESGFESVENVALATSNDPESQHAAVGMLLRELASGVIVRGEIDNVAFADRCQSAFEATGMIETQGQDRLQRLICDALDAPIDLSDRGFRADARTSVVEPSTQTMVTAQPLDDFLRHVFPLREKMLSPWLRTAGLAMIYGPRGVGKTMLAHRVGLAVASGGSLFKWVAPKSYNVLLIDGEMPREDLQARLKKAAGEQALKTFDHFWIAAADLTENGLPDLADPKVQPFYDSVIADADLIVIDNLSTLCRSIKENDADSWLPIQTWALAQRRKGKSVIFVHHAGKGGAQRGTSRKEDVLDTVIALRRPPDYRAEQGARFEVIFEKARGFFGPDAASFEATYVNGQWITGDIRSGDDMLRKLQESGMSIRDISERTGVSRSTVARRLKGGVS